MSQPTHILRIDASARQAGSTTRALAHQVINRLASQSDIQLTRRNVAEGLPFIDEEWVTANFTDEATRTPEQKAKLALSDQLIAEIEAANTVVIASPIYNFGVPATMKAWIDLVARAKRTFRYTPEGPVGLLEGKRAIIVIASGGTSVNSDIDFATPYLKHALAFIGITDVEVVAADALGQNAEKKLADAGEQIARLQAA